jgi:hypothetical protein
VSFAGTGTLRCLVDGGKRYTLKQGRAYPVTPQDFFFGKNGNPPPATSSGSPMAASPSPTLN